MNRLRKHYDKVALIACVLLFLGTASLSPIGFRKLDEIASRNPVAGIDLARYDARPAQMPAIETISWPDPPPQSRAKEWVYDVFTPPVIYYNRQTGEFTVTPPSITEPVAQTTAPFDIELLAVRQEPYRIQLLGYLGSERANLGMFELVETGETINARAGAEVARGEFTLRSLEQRRITTQTRDNTPVVETVTVATILDQRTGREETLTDRERRMLNRFQAVFRLRTNPPEERVVREGGTIEVNGQRYLVTQVSLNPPQAVVSRRAAEAFAPSETRTLTPPPEPVNPTSALESRSRGILSFPSR
jgi:hypothetical protein